MDAHKLGNFIATQRKELGLTQSDLAEKLHVTDKAISRWERGVGLPDINTIEPLATALNVSVLEVMKAELIVDTISEQDTTNAIKNVFELVEKKRIERRSTYMICVAVALVLALILMIDNFDFWLVVGVFLPTFGLVSGIVLLGFSIYRKKRNSPCKTTFVTGLILLLIPVVFVSILVAGFLMGTGPT